MEAVSKGKLDNLLYLLSFRSCSIKLVTDCFAQFYSVCRQQTTQQWRPSKKAIWGSVAGLVVVAALVFGLVFGINSSGSGSDNSVKPLSAGCQEMAQGT